MKLSKGICFVQNPVIQVDPITSLSIIGDPGCDGLGAATMSIFARALTCTVSDLTIVAGDLVHRGIQTLYGSIRDFINSVSLSPVLTLCGNHDTAHYDEFFGLRNYTVTDGQTLLIFLDNSKRLFESPTLDFLQNTLEARKEKQVLLFFHIPLANPVSTNTVNAGESEKFLSVIQPHIKRIRYFFCGHVHSYYEAVIGGVKMIVTGGGGARIEYVSDKADPSRGYHHIVKLQITKDSITDEYIPLDRVSYTRETDDPSLKEKLAGALENEAIAHIRYRLFAEDAQNKGYPGAAKMFRAFADSEYYHAKNHFYSLNEIGTLDHHLRESRDNEQYEVETMYREYMEYAASRKFGLAGYSFMDSYEAEKTHKKILNETISALEAGRDIPVETYHTCTSCGYTFSGNAKPANCPVCGAPHDKIMEVK